MCVLGATTKIFSWAQAKRLERFITIASRSVGQTGGTPSNQKPASKRAKTPTSGLSGVAAMALIAGLMALDRSQAIEIVDGFTLLTEALGVEATRTLDDGTLEVTMLFGN